MQGTALSRNRALWIGALTCLASTAIYLVLHRNPSSSSLVIPLPSEKALYQSLDKDFSKLVMGPTTPVRVKRSDEDESFTISFCRRGDLVDEVENVVLRYDAAAGSLLRAKGEPGTNPAPVCTDRFSRIDLSWDDQDETKLKVSVCARNRDATGKKRGPTFSWKIDSSF